MTPSDKLRELAELSEKSRHGGIEDTFQFRNALMDWYRTEGRQLAEDGLRYRWLRADIARGDTQIGYLPKYLTHVSSPDMMDAAVDALIDAARGEIT